MCYNLGCPYDIIYIMTIDCSSNGRVLLSEESTGHKQSIQGPGFW